MCWIGGVSLVTSWALCFGPCFVDVDIAAFEIFSVQGLNGEFGFIIDGHFDKAETFGTTRFTVADYVGAGHFTEGGKGFPKIFISYGVG